MDKGLFYAGAAIGGVVFAAGLASSIMWLAIVGPIVAIASAAMIFATPDTKDVVNVKEAEITKETEAIYQVANQKEEPDLKNEQRKKPSRLEVLDRNFDSFADRILAMKSHNTGMAHQ